MKCSVRSLAWRSSSFSGRCRSVGVCGAGMGPVTGMVHVKNGHTARRGRSGEGGLEAIGGKRKIPQRPVKVSSHDVKSLEKICNSKKMCNFEKFRMRWLLFVGLAGTHTLF